MLALVEQPKMHGHHGPPDRTAHKWRLMKPLLHSMTFLLGSWCKPRRLYHYMCPVPGNNERSTSMCIQAICSSSLMMTEQKLIMHPLASC